MNFDVDIAETKFRIVEEFITVTHRTNQSYCTMSYFLERLIGNSRNEQIPLTGGRMTIGRSIDSSIQIISPLVSRCHAVLMFENNHWIIKDVKSINGVYVNNTKLLAEGTYTLIDKDIISLGPPEKTEFRYCYYKRKLESDATQENERPCKIKKRENFQSASDVNVANLVSLENFLSKKERSNLHVKAECTISSNNKEGTALLESQTSDGAKLTLPKEGISSKNVCENSKVIKAMVSSHLSSENIDSAGLCSSSNETNSEKLKLPIESHQLSVSKQKQHEELQNKLLRTEIKLSEHHESEKQENENLEKSIQEKIKNETLQQVGDIMETEFICGICTELFVEAVTLNCSHTFCKFCIQTWKEKKKICPICRARIKTETRALVLDNFIEKMVGSLNNEMKEHRKKLIEERLDLTSKNKKGSNHKSHFEAYIVISDIDSEDSYDSDFNDPDSDFSDSSIDGMPWAYYGGYGRCYTCGRRGHWANGCPGV